MAGAQLLLVPCGEQERVVDPRADAEHPGERRREPGHGRHGRGPEQDRRSRRRRRRRRRAARSRAARALRSTSSSRITATTRPATSPIGKPPVAEPSNSSPANATCVARGQRVGRRPRAARSRPVPRASDRHVVLDGGRDGRRRRATVRVSTPATCGWPSTCLREGTTGGLRPPSPVSDDGGLGARLRGEAVFEQVLCPLGLDPGHGEVVLEAASGGYGAADERRRSARSTRSVTRRGARPARVARRESMRTGFARLSRIFNSV